jgi:cytochrome c-type protein NapB
MNRFILLILTITLLWNGAVSWAGEGVSEDSLGLSKTSVFDAPVPDAFAYSDAFPGTSERLPLAYPGAPPQIPHEIDQFLPVTRASNKCLVCHNQPQFREQKELVLATPMPASHYTDLREDPGKVTQNLIGARYVCNQCHVPQAEVKPLVENTFSK